jgi:uncharacterized protein YihD (DUF1040 family)
MSRDPERQKRIIKLVERLWKKLPNLRLLQLLTNCLDIEDPYYVEDDFIEKQIRIVYREYLI